MEVQTERGSKEGRTPAVE